MRRIAVVLVFTAFLSSALAEDGPVERGQKMSQAAVELARSGSYAEAITLFEKAYDLTGDSMILYNIGQVAARMGDLPKAKEYLERFLKVEKRPADLQRGREALAEVLARWPGWLRVTSPTQGALVEVDGKPVGRTPLKQPIELSPGTHALKVIAPGKRVFERQVEVAASEATSLSAVLEEEPGRLRVQVEPATAHVRIDGKVVERGRGGSVELAPGSHFVRVEAEGYEAEEKTVEMKAGVEARLDVALRKKAAPIVVAVKSEPPKAVAANDLSAKTPVIEKKGLSTMSWVLIGTGAAAVVAGGIVAGVLLANSGGGGQSFDGEIQVTKPLEVGP